MANRTRGWVGVIIIVLSLNMVFAQKPQNRSGGGERTPPTITGSVVDESGAPVPYASLSLYRSSDSTLARGVASDENGIFTIPARPGNYYLLVSFLSYKPTIIEDIKHTPAGVVLGKITLQPDAEILDEFEVIEERSQMELQLDKRVFTVGKDLANTGSNAAEVLDNVPSVSVDVEGNVSLRGSENVRILIDGKPSGMVGISATDALRQLQGNMIDRVEVITNPSARYDAEGEVGIINIVLKKDTRKGLNGSVELIAGYPTNYGASLSLNYRKKWVNLFTSYGIALRETPGRGSVYQESTGDSLFIYEQERKHERGGLSNNARLGTDLYLNKRNTLTLSGLYKYSDGNNNAELTYKDFNSSNELTQTVTRTDDEKETRETIEGSISYNKKFPQKGREWTTDAKWIKSDDIEASEFFEQSNLGGRPLIQQASNTENEERMFFQSDYVHPFAKKGKFETGVRSTLRTIENDYTVQEQDSNGQFNILPQFNNEFIYTENIYAGYLMAGNQTGKFSYQGGLRAEYSDIRTDLLITNEKNHRTYLNLFPSVHLAYEVDSSNTFQLSYSRRISRPRFRHLLPFFTFSDNRNFFSGNPNLDPEYTNSFEVGHLKYFSKGSILSSIYYRHRTGVIERITLLDTVSVTRILPINLSTQDAFGLEFNFNLDLAKWWRVNASFNFYRAITEGSFEGRDYDSDTYTWTTQGNSKFSISKKTDLQISFNYRAPRITTQGRTKSMYSTNLGLAHEILNGNGTLTFSAKDIFNTRVRRSVVEGSNFYSESEFQWRSRQFLVSFTYRLNQKKQRQRKSGDFEGDDLDF